jgi:hypothetical protein
MNRSEQVWQLNSEFLPIPVSPSLCPSTRPYKLCDSTAQLKRIIATPWLRVTRGSAPDRFARHTLRGITSFSSYSPSLHPPLLFLILGIYGREEWGNWTDNEFIEQLLRCDCCKLYRCWSAQVNTLCLQHVVSVLVSTSYPNNFTVYRFRTRCSVILYNFYMSVLSDFFSLPAQLVPHVKRSECESIVIVADILF